MLRVPRIRPMSCVFVWSEKKFSSFLTKRKTSYLTDSQYSICLLKKYSCLQHLEQNKHIKTCKTPDFFFWLIFIISSPPSMTTLRFLDSSLMNTNLSESSKGVLAYFLDTAAQMRSKIAVNAVHSVCISANSRQLIMI